MLILVKYPFLLFFLLLKMLYFEKHTKFLSTITGNPEFEHKVGSGLVSFALFGW